MEQIKRQQAWHVQIKRQKPNEQSRTMRSEIFMQLLCHPNFPTCSLLFLMMHR
jgi:hypothetical protein